MRNTWWSVLVPAALGLAGVAVTWEHVSQAAPPPANQQSATTTLKGKIQEFVKNDHADVDGLRLAEGTLVHFPPHMAVRFMDKFKVGDGIEIVGHPATRRDGLAVFEAEAISSGEVLVRVGPPQPRGKEEETPMNAVGKVVQFHKNDHDDVDGFQLADGTLVKTPPHQGAVLQQIVSAGAEVKIEGRKHVTPQGDVHLHADQVEVVATGKTFKRDAPGGKHPGPKPKPGPHARHDDEDGVTNADLLKELQHIRRLLEEANKR